MADDNDDFGERFEEFCELTEEQVDAVLEREMAEYSRWYCNLTSLQQYRSGQPCSPQDQLTKVLVSGRPHHATPSGFPSVRFSAIIRPSWPPKYHPTPLSGGDRKALTKELARARAVTTILASRSAEKRAAGEALIREADDLRETTYSPRRSEERHDLPPVVDSGAGSRRRNSMQARQILFASCAALLLGTGIAQAGPCNMTNKDAGSGPTPGHTETTGKAQSDRGEHPPTSMMNRASGDVATSSQDTQKQMQNQPTAAQEAQGAKSKAGADDC